MSINKRVLVIIESNYNIFGLLNKNNVYSQYFKRDYTFSAKPLKKKLLIK